MSATKNDQGKPRHDLIPPAVLTELASVLTYGAHKKYDAHNWTKGFDWSRLYASIQRHLTAFAEGEDIDADSGYRSLTCALAELTFLLAHQLYGYGKDDRHPWTQGAKIIVDKNLDWRAPKEPVDFDDEPTQPFTREF
jgi:hypothetical protein